MAGEAGLKHVTRTCGRSWTHLNVGPVPLGGSLEGQVRQRRLLAPSNIHLEHVARFRCHDADDRVSFGGDILNTNTRLARPGPAQLSLLGAPEPTADTDLK